MNETFHIPISEGTEDSNSLASEWDNLAEEYTDDDFTRQTQEIAERNTFDFKDEQVEKSEAEKTYENKERAFLSELEAINDKRSRYLFNAGDDFNDIMRKFGDPRAKRTEEAFDELTAISKNAGRKTLESLVRLVDLTYPSPYKEEKPSLPNPFEDEEMSDKRRLDDARDEYRRAVLRESGMTAETMEKFSKVFTSEGNQRDYYVGNSIKTLGQGHADSQNAFSNAVLRYLDNPTIDNKRGLRRAGGDRENLTTNTLFNIAGTFDESRTRMGSKMFEPTIALATQLVRADEDFFDNIIDYIQFKINNSDKKKTVNPETVELPENNLLAGDVIS
ncbi:hypothetical protein IJ798_01745 [Candidatus Saccharibacteria bacterium]|nr:hypothetical protein [Candidatus Saccharibacteria bacterium]